VPEVAEEDETPAQAEWREVYTSQRLPAPRLGPVAVKAVAGGSGARRPVAEAAERALGRS
jgi:hypothetical protein